MNGKPSQSPLICPGHERPVVQLFYSNETPDGVFLSSASKDGSPMLRNGTSGDWIGTFKGHKGAVWSCVLTNDSYLAATGSADFTAKLWDSTTGEERHTINHPRMVKTVAFSNDGLNLVTGAADSKLRTYDLSKGSPVCSDFATAQKPLYRAAYSKDDRLIYASCTDLKGITVYDARTGEKVGEVATEGMSPSIEVSQSSDTITVASAHEVTFLDPSTFTAKKSHKLQHTVACASYSSERSKFVVGGQDMWVRLYDFESGTQLDCAKGHHGPVHTITFAPGGALYASGSEDGTIRIWDTDYYLKSGEEAGEGGDGAGVKAN